MPLSAHKHPTIVVPLLGDNTVVVRGLNLDDFMALVPNHFSDLSKLAVLYGEHRQSVFSSRAFGEFVVTIAKDFPSLIAEVISIAADEPDAKDVKLSTALQISVLGAVMKLTVEEAGGLGNLFAQLRVWGANLQEAQAELRGLSQKQPRSNSSIGGGESK